MSAHSIIIGYDASTEAKAAAAWALDEASRIGAQVEFFYAYEWPTWAPATATVAPPEVWPGGEIDRAIKGMLDQAITSARLSHPQVHTEISIVNGGAARNLLERSADASLVVLGSRGHSAVPGLLGSVSVAVSASARCPVVVVRGNPAPTTPVVVGVDDSDSSRSALAFAVGEASARGVPLRAIRAWPPVGGLWEETPMITHTVTEQERQPFDDLLQGWREKSPGLEISAEAVVEHPAAALVLASTTAQLLVVGTRGHGAVGGFLLGSVSQHLLRYSACSVAVIHEPKS